VLGNEHPDIVSSLDSLADLYKKQGWYEEAETLFLQVIKLSKKLLGHEHPFVANSLHNLAEIYENQYRYEEAGPLYLQVFELRKKGVR
jgi:tetratricopeptide (TPR) repeat protein